MEGVPGFEAEDSDGEGNQSHGLEQDEDHDRDEDLADLVLLAWKYGRWNVRRNWGHLKDALWRNAFDQTRFHENDETQ